VRNIQWKSLALLTGITTLFVGPQMLLRGLNIVSLTYYHAAIRFWSGVSPYSFPEPGCDWFKYSPLFAMLYRPLTFLPDNIHAFVWIILNAAVFWAGVLAWFPLSKKRSPWFWFLLVCASMELDGSLRYQQNNGSLIGLVLLALASYRDKIQRLSGFLLAFASNIKMLPGIFVLPLMWRSVKKENWQFFGAIFYSTVICLLLPGLVAGFSPTFTWHKEWLGILARDAAGTGIIDLVSVLIRLGLPNLKPWLPYSIIATTLLFMFRDAKPRWGLWFTLGSACALLCSPRTESPTFVLIAPAYLFLGEEILSLRKPLRNFGLGILVAAIFFISISFNDVWPRKIWNPHDLKFATKTLGVLALWLLSVSLYILPARFTPPQGDNGRVSPL
jgi:hypothetical protein